MYPLTNELSSTERVSIESIDVSMIAVDFFQIGIMDKNIFEIIEF